MHWQWYIRWQCWQHCRHRRRRRQFSLYVVFLYSVWRKTKEMCTMQYIKYEKRTETKIKYWNCLKGRILLHRIICVDKATRHAHFIYLCSNVCINIRCKRWWWSWWYINTIEWNNIHIGCERTTVSQSQGMLV